MKVHSSFFSIWGAKLPAWLVIFPTALDLCSQGAVKIDEITVCQITFLLNLKFVELTFDRSQTTVHRTAK